MRTRSDHISAVASSGSRAVHGASHVSRAQSANRDPRRILGRDLPSRRWHDGGRAREPRGAVRLNAVKRRDDRCVTSKGRSIYINVRNDNTTARGSHKVDTPFTALYLTKTRYLSAPSVDSVVRGCGRRDASFAHRCWSALSKRTAPHSVVTVQRGLASAHSSVPVR